VHGEVVVVVVSKFDQRSRALRKAPQTCARAVVVVVVVIVVRALHQK
jgi:hypothetical protein